MAVAKAGVRRRALAERDRLPPEARAVAAAAVARRIVDLVEWHDARTLGLYVAIGSEVPTRPLLEAALASGKRVAVPRTLVAEHAIALHEVESLDELAPGAFRVPEPDPRVHADVAREDVDVVVVPGVAFDATGHRLGYGRGYFDRFLDGFRGLKVGVTYDALVADALPAEAHDVRMDVLVTERRVIRVAR